MPVLNWVGKEQIVNHHKKVEYRVLERQYSFDSEGVHSEDNGSKNMIIHGDNLYALKSLLPKYEKKIKCVYIDPPYNTGNKDWCYNDNVDAPLFQKWLKEVLETKESERYVHSDDLTKHDKWLCMMYPRLSLIKKLLKDDGVLIISISYHELNNLIALCQELFSTYQITIVTVQTSGGKPSNGFNMVHEFLVYVTPNDFVPYHMDFVGSTERTPFEGLTLSTFDKKSRPNQAYPIFIDAVNGVLTGVGKTLQQRISDGEYTGDPLDFEYNYDEAPFGSVAIWPVTSKGKDCVWRLIPSRLQSDWDKGYIKITRNKNAKSKNKFSVQYLPEGVIEKVQNGSLSVLGHEPGAPTLILGTNATEGTEIPSIWEEKDFFTVKGTGELQSIFGEKKFDYPKPSELITQVLQSVTKNDDIILDSFAGSGTAGHATLKLNSKDGGNRSFILVETMNYAEEVTAERIKRVIRGYEDNLPLKGSFSYFELGEPLVKEGLLNENIDIQLIREYVYYTETKSSNCEPFEEGQYYLGTTNGTAYYFYYNPTSNTRLNEDSFKKIKKNVHSHVIFADSCSLSKDQMQEMGIIFKKIPRDISQL